MLEKLIERTNAIEFYQDCNLKFISYSIKSHNKVEFLFSINQISYDVPIEYEEWKISCENLKEFQGFENEILMPYPKIRLFDHHSLLWKFNEKHFECDINNYTNDVSKLIGDLYLELEDKTGNWIRINDYIWNIRDYFDEDYNRSLILPESLAMIVKNVFTKHHLDFKILNNDSQDKWISEQPSKLLMFGNNDVSPYSFNLHQHYIISENFVVERIK
ncbi:hypothetical protein [Flavobacterium soli]|uniref:hypothetical protein n=1 Tax=Flavobacterium soli TaxID=344881 RepID=UPI0004137607|nr:hypothetical protein [Flavobacterium soli]